MAASTPPVACSNLWKVFGTAEKEALKYIVDDGLSKEEVFDRFGCVVGVADATFEVAAGEIFCIMGLSGSGKSTLVRHINRLIKPSLGSVFIHGEDINKFDERRLRELRATTIGMVFQHMSLWPHRSLIDNIAFGLEVQGIGPKERRKIALETLEMMGLVAWADRYPDELSGGMQQRVGIARAIAGNPSILLMDEPFSALDPLIRRQLQDQFLELSRSVKKTTIFITHDLEEAVRIGDRIAIMNDGVIIQIGTPEEIVMSPANDYVARFVEGGAKLQVLSAKSVMQPVASFRAANPIDDAAFDALMSVDPETKLNGIIQVALDADTPVRVVDDGKTVGVITSRDLLEGITVPSRAG
nr:glycine betaine/L-proline ABC transporter ATP-binding protein [uncultured Roseovarius sp.]